MIENLAVVVPARNEGSRIAACLRSVRDAVIHLRAERGRIRVRVIVVLDSCTDDSRDVAARFSDVVLMHTLFSNVGAARAAGVERALTLLRDDAHPTSDPNDTWIASTDADSAVPAGWLVDHLRVAESGGDVALGSVEPVRAELSRRQRAAWDDAHPLGPVPGSVHGANLGVRASAYLAVGGFEPLPEHEDVELVRSLRATGARIAQLGGPPVMTSGRSIGRTPGGYAGYLAALGPVAAS